jgi:demethoxyubiquinone hydroxylase (CLK1/Coq7/Cat5 family)
MLDVWVSKYIKKTLGLSGYDLKWASYLLVTYAIEVRADELYPIYQEILTAKQSKIQVKSIIVEEVGHLNEMKAQLAEFSPDWERHATVACDLENRLFQNWIHSVSQLYPLN